MLDSTLLNIATEKQLFVDDLLVESVEDICRTWHDPQKVSQNPLVVKDQPWEHIPYFSCNTYQVIRDPADGLFKCWYTDWEKPEIRAGERSMGASVFNVLYAESEDGLTWRKPVFDHHPVDGRDTNIVIANGYNLGMAIDPHEADPARRFKGLYTGFQAGGDTGDIFAVTSPDGIRWNPMDERPTFGKHGSRLDDVIIIRYDPVGRLFVMNTRHYDMYAIARNLQNPTIGAWCLPHYPMDWRRMTKRRIWQAESPDLIHWTEPYPVLAAEDGLDDIDECFYGLAQYPAGDVTIGLLNIYHYVANTMCVRLVYSRNGKTWTHLNKRQPLLKPGGPGQWDAYMVTQPTVPIEVGDELYLFHGGSRNHHDWWITGAREGLDVPEATDISQVEYCLGLAKLRLDGFVSLDAGGVRRGILITRPFISTGTTLTVNARCRPGGSIAVEMVDVHDQVIPGCSRDQCDVLNGDSTGHVVSWQGRDKLPDVTNERAEYPKAELGRIRKIRFYMDNAELYSFRLS